MSDPTNTAGNPFGKSGHRGNSLGQPPYSTGPIGGDVVDPEAPTADLTPLVVRNGDRLAYEGDFDDDAHPRA